MKLRMKESYKKGVAIHLDLESCAVRREAGREAWTEGIVGRVSSCEKIIRSADPVGEWGRPHRGKRYRESAAGSA